MQKVAAMQACLVVRVLLVVVCLLLAGCAQLQAQLAAGDKDGVKAAVADEKLTGGQDKAASAEAKHDPGKAKKQAAKKEPPPKPKPVVFESRKPFLRLQLPGGYQTATGGPADPGLLLRAVHVDQGPPLVIRVRALAAAVSAPELGADFLSQEKSRLRRTLPQAMTGDDLRPVVGGRAALGFGYQAGGRNFRRLFVPAGEWLYIFTYGLTKQKQATPWRNLKLPQPALAKAATPAQPENEQERLRSWMYSFNPPDLERARERLRELRRQNPRDQNLVSMQAEAVALQALVLKRLGGSAEAVQWGSLRAKAVIAWRKSPDSAQALRGLGLAKLMEGYTDKARGYLEQAAAKDPHDGAAWLELALLELAQPEQAAALARRALQASAGLIGARLVLAWSQEELGRPAQAKPLYEAVLAAQPDNQPALLGLARALMDQPKNRDRAGLLLARLLKLDPKSQAARFNLAVVRYSQKRYLQAEEMAGQVLKVQPEDAEVLSLRGLAQDAQGKYREARASYQAALAVDPAHKPSLFNLGVLCATKLQDHSCAQWAFKHFLRLEPKGQRADKVRAWLVRNS